MIHFLLLGIAIALPAVPGWLALRLLEGQSPVLGRAERIIWAAIAGPTLCMLVTTVVFWTGLISLNLAGFLIPWLILTIILFGISWQRGLLTRQSGTLVIFASPGKPTKLQWITLGFLMLWTIIKLGAGALDLATTPTYWDDSFNNWNMRGKVFFVTKTLQPALQGESIQLSSPGGISSYPPNVALTKTWMATLNGVWDDTFENSIHVVWFLLLLGAFFWTLRRFSGIIVSLFGVYLLVSMPLVLLHGTNPYADIFVAMHLLITVSCLLQMAQADDHHSFLRWCLLFGFCSALLTFTKNEGTALYLPLCAVAAFWIVWRKIAMRTMTLAQALRLAAPGIVLFLCVGAPWFLYKVFNHLSFGNGKYLSDLSLSFHADALKAIIFQLTHEANFLLLPLVIVVTGIVGWKRIFVLPYSILTFIGLIAVSLQIGIFIFTGLATEAVLQTGLARGMLHVVPLLLLLVILVWNDAWKRSRQ